MRPGEISRPVKSPFGWHIIRMDGQRNFFEYDSLKADIMKFIEMRGLREKIINDKLDSLAKVQNTTPEAILDQRLVEMEAKDPDLKNLVREYHDGLLLFEVSNRTIWGKAASDEAGLLQYFKKHKKQYKWDEPRFKGMAYHVKDEADVAAVRNAVKGLPFGDWADKLRSTFNNDSVIRIRVEKGIFKKGDNPLVDRNEFKVNVNVTPTKDYPIDATYGKMIKAAGGDERRARTGDCRLPEPAGGAVGEGTAQEVSRRHQPRGIGHGQQALTNRGWPQSGASPK